MDQAAGLVAAAPLVEMRAIVKTFGSLVANDHIDLDIREGEVHALLGENGAGKSTLVKILYGLLQPTSGVIRWRGEPVVLPDPQSARRMGVGMVFQHFSLFDALTVAENVALALDDGLSARQIAERIGDVSRAYGLPLEPGREVWSLSVGERQRIEIVRCLMQNPRLLILDEPTSVLTPQETVGLFETLERIRTEGRSILYISHKLEEVRSICERATILRHGKVVAACDPREETAATLARMMVGAEVGAARRKPSAGDGPVRLAVRGLSLPAPDEHGVALKNIAFDVRGGEILGIAGVAGNGQGELFDALSGERTAPQARAVAIDGVDVGNSGVNERRRRGAAFAPEERLGHGTAPAMSLSDNAILTGHATNGFVRRGFIDRAAALDWVDRVVKTFDVRKGPRDPAARALSGGNLQKFVMGRELLREPGVLVVAQPTWGVDAGAAQIIRQALADQARAGAAVLVISQDLDELFEISDRMAVMFHGRMSQPQPADSLTREAVGLLMGGKGLEDPAEAAACAS
jgi:ABC-type uncharacterized transport system ATPase subunit